MNPVFTSSPASRAIGFQPLPILRMPVNGLHPVLPVAAPAPPSLPVADTRNGCLFADRFDSNLHWYLPDFALAADVDPSFAFAARQTGQQANGLPFNVATLSLRICKQQPAQAVQFAQANPTAVLREIALTNLSAVLGSTYIDPGGTPQQRTFNASSLQPQADGTVLLVFDGTILGDSVLALYQDLRVFGKAAITVNAGFQCWSQAQSPAPPTIVRNPILMSPRPYQVMAAPIGTSPMLMRPPVAMTLFHPGVPQPPPAPPPPDWIEIGQPYSETLPLNLKYDADGYQLRYAVATIGTPAHVILGAGDLSGFSQSQTQFAELKELGDLSLKYPTLSRAYVAVISKTIVLIPRRYSIVRSKTGCAATCLARVDSSASSASQCAFDFSFLIAPEASPIDLQKLGEEIASHPDLGGYRLTFADFLQTTPASTLLTSFASSVQFAVGANPHSFALTVTVLDAGTSVPAVANANLLIAQLSLQSGTDLIGSLSLKLDDGYPDPVTATIDLNFAHTAGSDELLAQMDASSQSIHVTNQSPLDLLLQDYAWIHGGSLDETTMPTTIAAGSSVSFPLPAGAPADGSGLQFASDAQLALPESMNVAAVAKYLNFQTVDVQDTRYVVALDASGVDFNKVQSVACTVTLPTLPSIAPWQTSLSANLKADSSHIQIPIENAVFTLPGTIQLNVTLVDPNAAAFALSLQNDFTANPVMVIRQDQIVAAMPPAAPPMPASSQPAATSSSPPTPPTSS